MWTVRFDTWLLHLSQRGVGESGDRESTQEVQNSEGREDDFCDLVQLKGLQAGTCRQAQSRASMDYK